MPYLNYIFTILKCGIYVGVQISQEYTRILKQSHTALFSSFYSRLHVSSQSW